MPADHFSFHVPESKIDEVINFLVSSLAHTGFKEMMRPAPTVVGLGEQVPYLWISGASMDGVSEDAQKRLLRGTHIAFAAKNMQEVRQFYTAALKAGGTDNGKPGRRPDYHPGYYGAFVRDPACGINFEMTFHGCPADEALIKQMEEEADA